MDIGLLLLRVVLGLLFVGHGTQKLFGWFSGHGLDGTGHFFERLGYRPGRIHAGVAGAAETAGGALLVLGLLTPLGAAAVIGVMLNAIVSIHWQNGLWNDDAGIEYPVVAATAAACLAFTGAGAVSLDNAIGADLSGAAPGLGALVLGILAGSLTLAVRQLDHYEYEYEYEYEFDAEAVAEDDGFEEEPPAYAELVEDDDDVVRGGAEVTTESPTSAGPRRRA
jgi:putative oxidoreductase